MGAKPDRQLKEIKKYLREKTIPVDVATPSQMNIEYHKTFLEHLGFVIDRKDGNQFYMKRFPTGWNKRLQMGVKDFCYLIDAKGRRRAALLYKYLGGVTGEEAKNAGIPVEFRKHYSKVSSHINYMPRYRTKIDHNIPFKLHSKNSLEHYNSPLIGRVVDAEFDIIYETKEKAMPVGYVDNKSEEYFTNEANLRTELYVECETWLNREYPDHSNIIKYWENSDED